MAERGERAVAHDEIERQRGNREDDRAREEAQHIALRAELGGKRHQQQRGEKRGDDLGVVRARRRLEDRACPVVQNVAKLLHHLRAGNRPEGRT